MSSKLKLVKTDLHPLNSQEHLHPGAAGATTGAGSFTSGSDSNSYVETSTHDANPVSSQIKAAAAPSGWATDAKTMPAPALKKKYKLTHTSWRGMKDRCKADKLELDQKLSDFADFLIEMSPRTDPNFTLDRIDPKKGYVIGNLRWASKTIQGINKGNVVSLTYKGETLTLVAWAAKTNQKADTLHKRKAKGWTDAEVIEGKSGGNASNGTSWADTPWPAGYEIQFEKAYIATSCTGESRLDFMVRDITRVLEAIRHQENEMDPCDELPVDEQRRIERLFEWLEDAKAKVERKRRRDSAINRHGGASRKQDERRYDAVHGKPPAYIRGVWVKPSDDSDHWPESD